MTALEDKIIKKVYTAESIDMCTRTALKITIVIVSGVMGVVSTTVLFQALSEQKTLALFEIFSEDREIIGLYINEVLYVLYQELPKAQLFVTIVCLTVFTAIGVTSLPRLNRFTNRIKSLIKFWFLHETS